MEKHTLSDDEALISVDDVGELESMRDAYGKEGFEITGFCGTNGFLAVREMRSTEVQQNKKNMPRLIVQIVRHILFAIGGVWFAIGLISGLNIVQAAYMPVLVIGVLNLLILTPLLDTLTPNYNEFVWVFACDHQLDDITDLFRRLRHDSNVYVRTLAAQKTKIANQKDDPIKWFHILVAILFPYIGLPWGIVNLCRNKLRSGPVMVMISIPILLIWIIKFIDMAL